MVGSSTFCTCIARQCNPAPRGSRGLRRSRVSPSPALGLVSATCASFRIPRPGPFWGAASRVRRRSRRASAGRAWTRAPRLSPARGPRRSPPPSRWQPAGRPRSRPGQRPRPSRRRTTPPTPGRGSLAPWRPPPTPSSGPRTAWVSRRPGPRTLPPRPPSASGALPPRRNRTSVTLPAAPAGETPRRPAVRLRPKGGPTDRSAPVSDPFRRAERARDPESSDPGPAPFRSVKALATGSRTNQSPRMRDTAS